MQVTLLAAAIVKTKNVRGLIWELEFDEEPNVEPGEPYRTFSPSLRFADAGSFLALSVDGNRVVAKGQHGWFPVTGHVILPG